MNANPTNLDDRRTSAYAANCDLARGLREVADWLSEHPELPKFHGFVNVSVWGEKARDDLTAVAAALGNRASESVDHYGDVRISADFGPVDVRASASPRYLGGVEVPKPRPAYEPIIEPRS
jgi:hypothetical protein